MPSGRYQNHLQLAHLPVSLQNPTSCQLSSVLHKIKCSLSFTGSFVAALSIQGLKKLEKKNFFKGTFLSLAMFKFYTLSYGHFRYVLAQFCIKPHNQICKDIIDDKERKKRDQSVILHKSRLMKAKKIISPTQLHSFVFVFMTSQGTPIHQNTSCQLRSFTQVCQSVYT